MPVVDTQTHWYPDELWEAYARAEGYPQCRRNGAEYEIEILPGRWWTVPAAFRDLERQYADLKEQGVDYMLSSSASFGDVDYLPVSHAVEVATSLNELRRQAERDFPGFLGLATIPWQDASAALEVLDQAVGLGLRGVLLHSNVAMTPLDSDGLRPIYARLAELDVPVFLHPARSPMEEQMADYGLEIIVGYMYETSTAVLRLILGGVLNDFPSLRIVHPHAGACLPYLGGRIDGSYSKPYAVGEEWDHPPTDQMKRTYTDTMCQDPATLRFARDFYPADHIMFASDYPYFSPRAMLDFVRANVEPESLDAILQTNAARLLNLDL